jgi:hypothetical protein
MVQHKLSMSFAAVLLASLANGQSVIKVNDLNRFDHGAQIPADADLASIKLRGVKLVSVPTKLEWNYDPSYCSELAFRDPGGSMYCPRIKFKGQERAYELTYSYTAQPMASDEYGGKYFTFSVYFRPEELTLPLREALAGSRSAQKDAAGLFDITTFSTPERRSAIDQENSRFCEGNFADGAWIQTDARCRDEVKHKTVTVASNFVTVRVSPPSQQITSR